MANMNAPANAAGANRPVVSVVIPCFNAAATLPECLDSVFGQDRPPDEVLLMDDGSTDETAAIARSYGDRLTFRSQPRLGPGAARNAAVRLARGDVIGFLDADDLWPPDSLRCRLAVLEGDPHVAAVTGLVAHFRAPAEGRPGGGRPLPPVQKVRIICAMLVRRTVFDRIGWFDDTDRLGEQFDWVARLADSGLRMAEVNQIVWRRRVHDRNIGTRLRDQRGEYLHVLKEMLDRRRAQAG